MPEGRRPPEQRLEEILTSGARDVSYPATPDLASAVAQRLESAPPPHRDIQRLRFAYAAAAVLVALGLFFSVSSGARRAVADWLGVSGIRIEVDPDAPPPSSSTGRAQPDLGEAMTLAEAIDRAAFEPKLPATGPFAEPDEVYVAGSGPATRVSFVYAPGDGIPASDVTGAGAVLTQFEGELSPDSLKTVGGAGAGLRVATLNGRPAYWIDGPHEVTYLDPEGNPIPPSTRLAGTVLLWEQGSVTYRLESELTFQQALGVARSLPK